MDPRSAARRVVEEASSLLEGLLTTVAVGVVICDIRGQAGQSLTWLQQIRSALLNERLVLHGQPILPLTAGGHPPMYELLIRMCDETGTLIDPSSFLPTAEQFGLIRDIDRWVLARGLKFAARGNHVSIDLSGRSLADPDLTARVRTSSSGPGRGPST